jgi:predicted acylesterase/phospholipase RssA
MAMDSSHSTPSQPFKHIALSLSGGGVRAVGYHLGTLDYLNHLGMLSEIHTLSSVSGGSLIATGFALSQKKGESFQEFYDNVCEFLPELNTLEELLKTLKDPNPPVASGAKTLITSFASVYREKFFKRYYDDAKFGIFWEKDPEIPLKEIIFNATEFKAGIAFRFQKSQYQSVIGNGKVWLDEEVAKEIRMSDIMAASSCIPAAMEPMNFPQDFHWPGDPEGKAARGGRAARPFCKKVEAHLMDNFGVSTVPLMDGGVYDNQGISSIILSTARNYRGKQEQGEDVAFDEQAGIEPMRPHRWAQWLLQSMEQASSTENQKDMGEIDLFIVSDTPIRKDPMYVTNSEDEPEPGLFGRWWRSWSLGTLNYILIGVIVLFAGIVGLNIDALIDGQDGLIIADLIFISFVTLILLVPYLLLRRALSKKMSNMQEEMPPLKGTLWDYAKKITLGQIFDMARLRATSTSALTSRIFMHRIRQLGYTLLYSHDEFGKRIMDNNINDIRAIRPDDANDLPDFVEDPSDDVEYVVERASKMGTKLWISQPDRGRDDLEVLIAAGHISTCFNIIEYLWQFHRDEEGNLNENVRELFEHAKADWLKLGEDPYWLVDERQKVGKDRGGLYWIRKEYETKARLFGRKTRKTA